ncbi:MAG: nuclear transport factor 2 family protein [Longimicrobiales bacterium]|nr:nuclear transport factor 2 family protein [Longimicrobiales bacterium]
MSARTRRRGFIAIGLLALLPGSAVGQGGDARTLPTPVALNIAAERFVGAVASGEKSELRGLLAPSLRFTLNGQTRSGVRAEQAVVAMEFLLDHVTDVELEIQRVEPMGVDDASGFAEFRWRARDRDTGAHTDYTFLLIFERADPRWVVVELRILPRG